MNKKWLSKKWLSNKWVTIGAVCVLVLGGGYWTYKNFTAKPAVATNITAQAKMGSVKKVITATGAVSFPHSIPLTFPNTGRIVELNIKPGDSVKAGQVLAKMDDTKLQTAVLQQEATLTSAQSKLQILKDGYNAQTRAQAVAALAKAEQSLTTAEQNADSSYLANQVLLANQNVKLASDALAKAQQSGNTSSIQSLQNSLTQALKDLNTAQNAQNGGAALALESAKADLTAAHYQLDKDMDGPKSGDLQSAQASIAIAQAQLASAQTDLANATIIAPTDAIVVSSPLQLYEYTNTNSIITLTPTGSNLQVDASIDQADIAQVKVGQKVDITLDAYPNEHSSGSVSLVAVQGITASNVTTFKVTVAVDNASDKLRSGMNANIDIVVAEASNVLTVPSEAIKTIGTKKVVLVPITTTASSAGQKGQEGQAAPSGTKATASSGRSALNVSTRPVTVEVGLDDGTNVEIISGLTEGQEVVTGTSTVTTPKTTSGFSLGGGGNRAMSGGAGAGADARPGQ